MLPSVKMANGAVPASRAAASIRIIDPHPRPSSAGSVSATRRSSAHASASVGHRMTNHASFKASTLEKIERFDDGFFRRHAFLNTIMEVAPCGNENGRPKTGRPDAPPLPDGVLLALNYCAITILLGWIAETPLVVITNEVLKPSSRSSRSSFPLRTRFTQRSADSEMGRKPRITRAKQGLKGTKGSVHHDVSPCYQTTYEHSAWPARGSPPNAAVPLSRSPPDFSPGPGLFVQGRRRDRSGQRPGHAQMSSSKNLVPVRRGAGP